MPRCSYRCPCICHDTGGADYGMHGGGKCKGTATDDWEVKGKERSKRNMKHLRKRVEEAEKHGVPTLVVTTAELRELLENMDRNFDTLRELYERGDWDGSE